MLIEHGLYVTRGAANSGVFERPLEAARLEERILFSASAIAPVAAEIADAGDALASALVSTGDNAKVASDSGGLSDHQFLDLIADTILPQQSSDFGAPGVDTSTPEDPAADDDTDPEIQRTELVFVDTGIANYETIVNDIRANSRSTRAVQVVLLDATQDGLKQINLHMSGLTHTVDTVHFITHGTDRALKFGSTWIDVGSLASQQSDFEQWRNVLSPNADLLFYGCDLSSSESGRSILGSIALWADADVAGSDDATGQKSLGGDWDLEYAIGDIDSEIIVSGELQSEWRGLMASFTVTNTNDSGAGSLRQAIIDANNLAGTDTITFSIGSGVQTISLSSMLPDITSTVIINATTQSGYADTPLIVITGNNSIQDGLRLYGGSDNSTIRGLVLQGFTEDAIDITTSGNTIRGNYIGTNAAGTTSAGNANGVNIWSGDNNIIGGIVAADRNVISGNTNIGMYLGGGAHNTQIYGNYIGLNAAGTVALGNTYLGLLIDNSNGTILGGTTAGHRNVISGNGDAGVALINADNSVIYGNYIGTNAAGTADVNGTGWDSNQSGIYIDGGSSGNLVGNTIAGARNVISGNNHYGVEIGGATSLNNTVSGNYIGTDSTGLNAVGNTGGGVSFWGAGTGNVYSDNVISGNLDVGVLVGSASTGATIQGNLIGLGADGTTVVGNANAGVYVYGASTGTLIGTNADGAGDASEGNTISGNSHGIIVRGSGTTGTVIQGNQIGTNTAGTLDRGNANDGVLIENGASLTSVGGTSTGAGNLISGNNEGIEITGATTTLNVVQGNLIGLNASGTGVIANDFDGIHISLGAHHNTIGGIVVAASNVVSGNGASGIEVEGSGSDFNTIQGNSVGTDITGLVGLGNGNSGITLGSSAANNLIGGTDGGEGNVIASNGQSGIEINSSSSNTIQGNLIGIGADGITILGNTQHGIDLNSGSSSNLIGGVDEDAGNTIANNGLDGVSVDSSGGSGNSILGNSITLNGTRGIDLTDDGVTLNDAGDGDTGSNDLQNFPVLSVVNSSGGNTTIVGALNSDADTDYRIEFFSTSTGDASGFGEGQVYLGSTTVSTDASGDANFSIVLSGVTVTAGHKVSATATVDLGAGNFGSTSEFAANVTATANPAGVTVTPTSGLTTTEAGGTATFNISLDNAPTSAVTITLAANDPTEGTLSTTTVIFDSSNWSAPQTVTVTGVDDHLDEGNVAYSIITTASSSDAAYNSIAVSDISLTNIDNDTNNSIAYESFNYATGSLDTRNGGTGWSDAWTSAGSPTPMASTVAGSVKDPTGNLVHLADNSATTANADVAEYRNLSTTLGTAGTTKWMSFILRPNGSVTTNAYAGIGLGGTDNWGAGGLFIGGIGTGDYVLELVGGGSQIAATGSTVTPGTAALLVVKMEFLSGNDTFTLYVNPTPGRDAPDSSASMTAVQSALNLGSFTRIVMISGGTLTGTYDEIRFGNSFAEVAPGLIHVTPDTGLITSEDGNTDTFFVELAQAPTNNVSIGISSSDVTEGTVSTGSLTFTTSNWATAQTVTLSGVSDVLTDGDISYSAITAAATSSDAIFSGANAPDALALNLDDNQPPSDLERRNLILNGSFEGPDVAPIGQFASITGWTGNGDDVELVDNNASVSNNASDGTQFLELDAQDGVVTAGVYQDVTTVSGRTYTLTFDLAARGGTALATNTVQVYWRGSLIATVDPASTNWQTLSYTVTGSGGSDRLEFQHPSADDDGLGGLIDRVSLVEIFKVAEQAANGTSVGVVVGTDPMITDTLTYSLTDSAGGRFTINSLTGEVIVATSELLDYEQSTSHNITVRVTDQDGLFYDEVFAITVTDVSKENPTVIVPGAQTMNEDGTLIFSSGNSNLIRINSDAGNSLNVTLAATDGTLSLSGTTGLSFTSGDGTTDATMTFSGTVESINTALSGLSYQPTSEFSGSGSMAISTTDGTYARLNISANQKGLYTFDNTGALGTDNSGSGNTGTVVGATAFNDPTRGQVLSLDGNDYVQVAGHFGNPADVTLTAWVNLTTADSLGAEVISLGDSITLRVDDINDGLAAYIYNGSGYTRINFNTSLAGTGWHHAAISFSDAGNIATLYLDGTPVVATTVTSSISYTVGANSFIGKHGNGQTSYDFNGKLDDVRVYDVALTADEIESLALTTPSDSESVAVTVNAVNDAPMNSVPGSYNISEDPAPLTLTGLSVADTDASTGELTVTLSVNSGTMSATTGGGVTVAGSGTASLSLSGTVNDLNTYLSGGSVPAFHALADFNGTVTLTMVTNDNGNTGSGGALSDSDNVAINIAAVNDEQVIAKNAGATVNENSTGNIISSAMLLTTDIEQAAVSLIYTLTSPPGNGTLRKSGIALALSGTFTQADINSGIITYGHNGTQTSSDSFSFAADDGVGTASPGTFNLTITPGNDNSPIITSNGGGGSSSINVAENSTDVTTVTATDSDLPSQILTYSIIGGTDSALFAIDSNSGVLTFVSGRNRESYTDANTDGIYEVTVRVSDGTLVDDQAISVNVTDVDEFNVGIVSDTNVATDAVAENSAVGTTVGITANASDPDGSDSINYSLDNSAGGRFQIDSVTGIVTVANGTLLDRELAASHTITIRATSSDSSFSTQTFIVNLGDVDEFSVSSITDSNASVDGVDENSANGTIVGITANAFDSDVSSNSITWTLDDDAGGRFQVDANTGVITVANGTLLDFDSSTSHTILVRATSADSSSSTQAFVISLLDVNDAPPVITPGQQFNISELASVGTVFGPVAAVDPDGVGTLQGWTIISGNTDGIFEINPSTGALRIASTAMLNFETASAYALTLSVTDGAASSSPQSVLIQIVDDNEAPSLISLAGGSVQENRSAGTFVGQLSAVDSDAGDVFVWTLIDDANGAFVMNSTGRIAIAPGAVLNYEVMASYGIAAEVMDSGGLTHLQTFTIAVLDVNDAPVALADRIPGIQLTAIEVLAPGLLLNDTDEDGDALQTVLVTGPANGTLVLNTNGTLLYSPNGSFSGEDLFVYYVTDGTANSAPVTVSINVAAAVGSAPGGSSGDSAVSADGLTDSSAADSEGESTDSSEGSGEEITVVESSQLIAVPSAVADRSESTTTAKAIPSEPFIESGTSTANEDNVAITGEMIASVFVSDFFVNTRSERIKTVSAELAQAAAFGGMMMDNGIHNALVSLNFFTIERLIQRTDEPTVSEREELAGKVAVGSAAVVTTSLSVGYVIWILRGGSLLTTFMSAMPAWQAFDPLPVLQSFHKAVEEEDDSLLSIATRKTVDGLKKLRKS